MKRAKVLFENTLDNKIKIAMVTDVASYSEIREKFGSEVARLYFNNPGPHFQRRADAQVSGSPVVDVTWDWNRFVFFSRGSILEKDEFQDVIAAMKRAGDRLQEIIKGVKSMKVKEIII